MLPPRMHVRLRDSGRRVLLDVRNKRFELTGDSHMDAEVGDDDFLAFLEFPWGADTLNVTGNLKINSQFRWRWLAYLKHTSYVMAEKPAFVRACVAVAGATIRGLQHRLKAS